MRFICTFFVVALLCACGSNDEKNREIYGLWEGNDGSTDVYFDFKPDRATVYSYNPFYECYREINHNIQYLDEEQGFEVFAANSSDSSVFSFDISGEVLTLNDENAYTRSSIETSNLVSCEDGSIAGEIDIQVTFDHIPSNLELVDYQHIRIGFSFDVDESDDYNDRDIIVYFSGYSDQEAGDAPIDIESMLAESYLAVESDPDYDGPDEAFTLAYIDDYVISSNTLTFTIDRSAHKAFSSITATTSFQMEAYISKNIGDFNEDTFPDEGYTTPSSDLMDNADDIDYGNEDALGLDILDVSVVVTED